MAQLQQWQCSDDQLAQLVRRLDLAPVLMRRHIEEEIAALVAFPEAWSDERLQAFCEQHQLQEASALEGWLHSKGWQHEDLRADLIRQEALQRFAQDRFGPGLEDLFLQRKDQLDSLVYSLLRVRDPGLARELWIQISEGEISFSQAASHYGEGPEARHAGLIGPVVAGALHPPELVSWLRRLRPGEVHQPQRLGEWTLLLQLEQITPAVLDSAMAERLIDEQLEEWLNDRSRRLLSGESVEPLTYHPNHD